MAKNLATWLRLQMKDHTIRCKCGHTAEMHDEGGGGWAPHCTAENCDCMSSPLTYPQRFVIEDV